MEEKQVNLNSEGNRWQRRKEQRPSEIIQAARVGCSVEGCTLYCTHQPCVICAKIIINSGIFRVVYKDGYPDNFSLRLFEEAGVKIEKYENLQ